MRKTTSINNSESNDDFEASDYKIILRLLWLIYFILLLLLFFFFLLYNIVLFLPYINMHLPRVNQLLLAYSCFAMLVSTVQQSESILPIHISPLFWISFPFRLPQSRQYSSLCYTVGSHYLPVLYVVVYIYVSFISQFIPNPIPPLVTINLFSTSVILFLLCK